MPTLLYGYTIYYAEGKVLWGVKSRHSTVYDCNPNTPETEPDSTSNVDITTKGSISSEEEVSETPTSVVRATQEDTDKASDSVDSQQWQQERDIKECRCTVEGLHLAEERCVGRTRIEQEQENLPFTLIAVPEESYVRRVSTAEEAAHKLIPFQEAS